MPTVRDFEAKIPILGPKSAIMDLKLGESSQFQELFPKIYHLRPKKLAFKIMSARGTPIKPIFAHFQENAHFGAKIRHHGSENLTVDSFSETLSKNVPF